MIEKKELSKMRHPWEKILFYLTAIPMLLIFVGFLVFWAFNAQMLETYVKDNIIDEIVSEKDIVQTVIEEKKEELREKNKISIDDEETIEENINIEEEKKKFDEEQTEMYKFYKFLRDDILVSLIASPATPIFILLAFILLTIFGVGKIYGDSIGNGVKVSRKQFPEVYKIFDEMAKQVGLSKTPEIVLVNGNGQLNAFACTIPMIRDVVVIYSDIFEKCIANNDMKTLKFVLGHELGHIKFHHTKWWYKMLVMPMELIPFSGAILGKGLSRANEYSCDKLGAKLAFDEKGEGLMILASGKHLYKDVDIEEYVKDNDKKNIWVTYANFFIDHPITAWRILAIYKKQHGGIWFRKK